MHPLVISSRHTAKIFTLSFVIYLEITDVKPEKMQTKAHAVKRENVPEETPLTTASENESLAVSELLLLC